MEKTLQKARNLKIRIAQEKARFNAFSGVAITIAGPTDAGFMPALASTDWPPDDLGDDDGDDGVIDVYKNNSVTNRIPTPEELEGILLYLNKDNLPQA